MWAIILSFFARLENASWRTWAKQRNKLKTISPETLNWSVLFLSPPEAHPSDELD
jgi:hypothetical protein